MAQSPKLKAKSRCRMLALSAACLLPVSMAGCGPKPEVVTQIVVKPIAPEPVPAALLDAIPDPKCPADRVEYAVPKLEQRGRCFERDAAITRSRLSQLQAAVKERENRSKELANRAE